MMKKIAYIMAALALVNCGLNAIHYHNYWRALDQVTISMLWYVIAKYESALGKAVEVLKQLFDYLKNETHRRI